MLEEIMDIIPITFDDIDRIKTLWEGLRAHHRSISTNFKLFYDQFTFEARIESLKNRDQLIVYVAQEEMQPIGYCIASIDNLVGEIDSIFILSRYRRTGIGSELVSLALKWIEDHGCKTIKVGIAQGNEEAFDFYRRFGFAERMTIMQKIA